MNSRITVTALLALVLAAGTAWAAKCDMLSEEAVGKLKQLRADMEKADEKNQKDAQAIADFLPTFKAAVEGVEAAYKALQDHEKSKPKKDEKKTVFGINPNTPIVGGAADALAPDGRSLENQAQVKEWEAQKLRLQATMEGKVKELQGAIDRLGNWRGNVRQFFLGEQNAWDQRDDVREALRELGEKGDGPKAQYDALFYKLGEEKPFVVERMEKRLKPAGANSGLIDVAEESRKAKREKRKAVIDFENKCPAAAARLEIDATRGREADARAQAAGGAGGGDNSGNGGGATATRPDDATEDDLSAVTGSGNGGDEGDTRPAGGGTTATAATGGTTTGGGSSGGATTYTVNPGDNLSKIARELAPSLGNPSVDKLVSVLYQNMKTSSKDNPNLIFPGDTIDLEAVRKQLAG